MHYKIVVTCVYNGHMYVLYSDVDLITPQSNPPVSKFRSVVNVSI